jgi:hypothetical protein
MNGGRVRDFILGVVLASVVVAGPSPVNATNQLPVPKQIIEKDYELRSRIGLEDSLFDGIIDPESKNYELSDKGITVIYDGNNPSIDVHLMISKDEEKISRCSFDNNIGHFSNLIEYLTDKAHKALKEQEKGEKDWANKWQVGYSTIGPTLTYWHNWDINERTEAELTLDAALTHVKIEASATEREDSKQRAAKIRLIQGKDVDDEKFRHIEAEYQRFELDKKTGELFAIGQRYSMNESELTAKYGAVHTDDIAKGGLLYYDKSLGAKVYLGFLTENSDPNKANKALIEQMSSYNVRSPTGNHPILSEDILFQLGLGIEGEHPNAEALANIYNTVGIFAGIGSYSHNYDPYIGAAVKLGENFPTLIISASEEQFFVDIKTPRYGFKELKEKIQDIY